MLLVLHMTERPGLDSTGPEQLVLREFASMTPEASRIAEHLAAARQTLDRVEPNELPAVVAQAPWWSTFGPRRIGARRANCPARSSWRASIFSGESTRRASTASQKRHRDDGSSSCAMRAPRPPSQRSRCAYSAWTPPTSSAAFGRFAASSGWPRPLPQNAGSMARREPARRQHACSREHSYSAIVLERQDPIAASRSAGSCPPGRAPPH